MRHAFIAILLAAAACASGPRPVNVAAVRAEINETLQAESSDRKVTSMGKTSTERAVVFTTSASGARAEETWVKTNGVWKLENATALTTATNSPAAP